MLSVTVKISNIDYERTLQNLFPAAREKVRAADSKEMIVRLLQKLDDAALPVLIGIAYRLPEDTKNEFFIRCLNAYAPVLKEKLNEELQKDPWGRCFAVGTISAGIREGILLDIGQIEVEYRALLNHEAVDDFIEKRLGRFSSLAKAAAAVAGNTIERAGLELIQREENKNRLRELVRRSLLKHGIKVDVEEIQLLREKKAAVDSAEVVQPFTMTGKMEEDVLAALAGYLRDSAAGGLAVPSAPNGTRGA